MPQVRDRAGKVTTVSVADAKDLTATGFYQYVGPVTDLTLTEPVAGYPDHLAPQQDWFGGDYEDYQTRSQVGRWDAADPVSGNYGDNFTEYVQTQPTGEDLATVERYWTAMQRDGGAMFWNTFYGPTDADGYADKIMTPINGRGWDIERDAAAAEWTDAMLDWVTTKFYNGPELLGPTEDQEGLIPEPGGGRGGGARGPTYVSPMREVVEDTVTSMLTTLTGDPNEAMVTEKTDMFLKAHKQQYDVRMTGGEDIDPNQVVLEAIRMQDDYIDAHKLRPESSSETRWIPDRVARLSQLGMTAVDADERAIWLAQTGVNLNEIETGAAQMVKGRKDITLFDKIGKAAQQVVGQL